MKKRRRIVALGDLHSGHRVGLTPPNHDGCPAARHRKYANIRRACWNAYAALADELKPIDVLLIAGDCIDGREPKTGGRDLIAVDRNEQVDMAIEALELWEAPTVVMVRGTPYHTGQLEAFEDIIAQALHAKIGDHEWVTVRDGDSKPALTFDIKHKIGASQIPHGRATAIKRDQLWNSLWAEAGMQPLANWILRGHVHYNEGNWKWRGDRQVWGMTLPALQAMGSIYGAQECSGLVDWGLVHWDVFENGETAWQAHVKQIQAQRASALIV